MALESRVQGLLELSPDALVVTRSDGHIVGVNQRACALFGRGRDELVGQTARALMFWRDGDLVGLRSDGAELTLDASVSRVAGSAHEIAALRDITDRKQLESRLREANRFKSELVTHLAHELRTPLNGVMGFSDLLLRGAAGALAPEQQEFVGHIARASEHLLELVNDMLDLAKVESGTMPFATAVVDLSQLVGEVRGILSGMARDRSQDIVVDVSPTVREVVVDPARVKQVLYNFLSNAIKYTPRGGRISIRTAADSVPELFRLEVSDTGPGISDQDCGRLFREFQQLGNAGRTSGTGLGLAVAKRVVEGHGGRIEVTSRPGEGCTFTAILPRRPRA